VDVDDDAFVGGRERKEKERGKKKEKKKEQEEIPDALSLTGFVCDLHSQGRVPPSFYSRTLRLTP
jgi:hypothetical protein